MKTIEARSALSKSTVSEFLSSRNARSNLHAKLVVIGPIAVKAANKWVSVENLDYEFYDLWVHLGCFSTPSFKSGG
jgi:hypothetical protein